MTKVNNLYKGIICIIMSAFCFAVMNACVRASGDLPLGQKAFFRNFIALIIAMGVLISQKKSFLPKKEHIFGLTARAVCGTLGLLCNFYAQDRLNLSDASILNKMSPFFTIIFSMLILKEKINFKQAMFVVIAFVGALFVIKPSFANAELFPSLIGFLGGLGAGCAYAFVRKLGNNGCYKSYIVFYFSLFSSLVTLPFFIFQFKPMTVAQLGILILCGAAAAGGQYFITFAYFFAPARDISVYDYSQIIFAFGLGLIFFNQVPDILSFVGYVIIISMAVAMFVYEKKRISKTITK